MPLASYFTWPLCFIDFSIPKIIFIFLHLISNLLLHIESEEETKIL